MEQTFWSISVVIVVLWPFSSVLVLHISVMPAMTTSNVLPRYQN